MQFYAMPVKRRPASQPERLSKRGPPAALTGQLPRKHGRVDKSNVDTTCGSLNVSQGGAALPIIAAGSGIAVPATAEPQHAADAGV